jgi:hypothetical protein
MISPPASTMPSGGGVDLMVELIGGIEPAASIMRDALQRGTHVVTANKAAVAAHHDALHTAARAGRGVFLLCRRGLAAARRSSETLEAPRLRGDVEG